MDAVTWCFAWFEKGPGSETKTRAELAREARWSYRSVITISFLDGGPELRQRVKQTALQWIGPGLAHLHFDFRSDHRTLIRISFRYPGCWSVLGNRCRQITDLSRPTMNLGGLGEDTPPEHFDRVVLHEFGHALGLIHEHHYPGQEEMHWNKDAVYRRLDTAPYYWTREQVDRNLFDPWKKLESNYIHCDTKSIMRCPVPSAWTNDGFSLDLNPRLSPMDSFFVRRHYP